MPAYQFNKVFIPKILSGEKTTTIRQKNKKHQAVKGDPIYFYSGWNTPKCNKFAEATCLSSMPINLLIINSCLASITLNEHILTPKEVKELVKNEGFQSEKMFSNFFTQLYNTDNLREYLFTGHLIKWENLIIVNDQSKNDINQHTGQ